MLWEQALLLGLVQGITEFLPISSSAHLRIAPALLGWADAGLAFSAVLHLGTLLAAVAYFWREILCLSGAAWQSLWQAERRRDAEARLAWWIAAGNLPAVVLGLTLRDLLEQARSLYLIAATLAAVALVLIAVERWKQPRGKAAAPAAESAAAAEDAQSLSSLAQRLSLGRVMGIGLCQSFALVPGVSRAGAAILGGLCYGLPRAEAVRFSFLIGLPAILGAGILELRPAWHALGGSSEGALILLSGLCAAALSGYLAIAFLLRYVRTHSLLPFMLYRLLLAALLFVLLSLRSGVLA